MRITFVAHATVVVEDDGATALFDPNYSKRLAYIFNKRKVPLPMRPERLPRPDAILVSRQSRGTTRTRPFSSPGTCGGL